MNHDLLMFTLDRIIAPNHNKKKEILSDIAADVLSGRGSDIDFEKLAEEEGLENVDKKVMVEYGQRILMQVLPEMKRYSPKTGIRSIDRIFCKARARHFSRQVNALTEEYSENLNCSY